MPPYRSDSIFKYLLTVSLLVHMGVIAAVFYYPEEKKTKEKEPVFIDLQDIPMPIQQPPQPVQNKSRSGQRSQAVRESAPAGKSSVDTDSRSARRSPQTPVGSNDSQQQYRKSSTQSKTAVIPGSSSQSLLKPKQQQQISPSPAQFFPRADRMAKLEESYRRKFENDIAEGDTRFLNSDDIVFGSFLRRFESAVYGVWRYPQEAAMKGHEGITPIRITFNRRGEITHVQQLDSSGFRELDDEAMRTLRAIGPVGGFPKGYEKDEFHLIAFFQYGGSRRSLR